jgi:hypothetical protein
MNLENVIFVRTTMNMNDANGGCSNHEDFKPDNGRIITKAEEKGISVADVTALININ